MWLPTLQNDHCEYNLKIKVIAVSIKKMRKSDKMKKEILTIWCFLTLLNLNAQEKERGINEVIVQGKFLNLPLKKVNENITVVTRKEIENSPAKSVEEILAQFTGLDIRKRG